MAIAVALAMPGSMAAAQTSECLEVGPTKSLTWPLLSEAAKRAICARHAATGPDASTGQHDSVVLDANRGAEGTSSAGTRPSGSDVRPVAGTANGSDDVRSLVATDSRSADVRGVAATRTDSADLRSEAAAPAGGSGERNGATPSWRGGVSGPVASSTSSPRSSGLAARPRLIDEGRTLVLLEEVRAPASERQPEVRLVTSERTGGAQVQMAGAGLSPQPAIAVACAWSRRSIPLSDFTHGPLRNVASYDVDESIARMVRTGTDCRIALGRASIALPPEMVPIVWPADR
jgi:hypothetical protein